MQMYGKFGGFPLNGALFGLVSYNDPCKMTALCWSAKCQGWLLAGPRQEVFGMKNGRLQSGNGILAKSFYP